MLPLLFLFCRLLGVGGYRNPVHYSIQIRARQYTYNPLIVSFVRGNNMQPVTLNGQSIKPGTVVCIGKNYAAHIAEMDSVAADDMVVFMKPATSIGQKLISVMDEPLHYEGEICLMILDGRVGAVGFGLDLTKRATQAKLKAAGLPWERSKAFTGSALFSDFVAAPESLDRLGIELQVDGSLRQKGDVSLMLYPPPYYPARAGSILSAGGLRYRHDRDASRCRYGTGWRVFARPNTRWSSRAGLRRMDRCVPPA